MISLSFDQLAEIISGTIQDSFGPNSVFSGVSIDSRTIKRGELFVAIRGEKHDGHDHVQQAVDRHAAGLLIEKKWADTSSVETEIPQIAVADTHETLLGMAENYRSKVNPFVAAITGSNGKTTTKEFTMSLLQAVEPDAFGSPGNLNNLFGLPLAIFKMPQNTKVAVLELGISTPSEMPRLAQVAQPDLICITNVGPSHLEKLGTVEEVARAKLQLVTASPGSTRLIVNGDDPVLMQEASTVSSNTLTFALENKADFEIDFSQESESGQEIVIDGKKFNLPLIGRHQAANLLAAYAIVRTMGYDFNDVDTAAIPFSTAPMRGQIERVGEIRVMADCYNANPESMKSALESFDQVSTGSRRLIVLGDMLELGEESERFHRQIGELVGKLGVELAVFIGPMSQFMREAAVSAGMKMEDTLQYSNALSASNITEYIRPHDFVLLKGSRGIGLEEVLSALRNVFGKGSAK